ncbi:hypothetical protein KOR42_12530 [Thalassoglobus neptunius]|uniref:DUF3500 domain-containing protein n=1 Tax=Thalassoglobus neptunius TaxID=1938619 RepID=A0A5C5X4G3_9PLAN|nr:DUF3500 domain-containing protein [Thalassoglobus neptunius]TWT57886.1 hypothetical protein KOR42_12530 [Thalassoglobus neptunius]
MTNFAPRVTRRSFLETAGATALSATLAPSLFAAPSRSSSAETVVQEFYETLSPQQRKEICFGFNSELRKRISANWHVTKPVIGDDFYTDSQQAMIHKIVKGMTSPDGYERLVEQTEFDDGGIDFYSVGIFGNPNEEKFQFELTGRHLTLRADGNSVDKAAFGGPIVYGHGEEGKPEDNIYFYQTQQTNRVFEALDTDQRKAALLKSAPKEAAVLTQKKDPHYPGIQVGTMSDDQKQLVKESLGVLLAPYREEDKAEVMQILEGIGGVDELRLAFYQQGDLASDKVWDIWRIEGPQFVWHFRGAPHVHAYINIGGAF